jgi:hypothetical protein
VNKDRKIKRRADKEFQIFEGLIRNLNFFEELIRNFPFIIPASTQSRPSTIHYYAVSATECE